MLRQFTLLLYNPKRVMSLPGRALLLPIHFCAISYLNFLIEPVLFSTLVQQKTFMFFTKSKLVIITDKRILVANSSKKVVRF